MASIPLENKEGLGPRIPFCAGGNKPSTRLDCDLKFGPVCTNSSIPHGYLDNHSNGGHYAIKKPSVDWGLHIFLSCGACFYCVPLLWLDVEGFSQISQPPTDLPLTMLIGERIHSIFSARESFQYK